MISHDRPVGRPVFANGAFPATLAEVLLPFDAARFLTDVYHRDFGLFRGHPDRFSGLFGWADLNRILRRCFPPESSIALVRRGKPIPSSRYMGPSPPSPGAGPPVRTHRIAHELRAGATLVLDRVVEYSDRLDLLARALEREFDTRVGVNLYAGFRTDNGFSLHWDRHDVFVLQIAGEKRWEVYPDTRPHPAPDERHFYPRPRYPVWKGLLRQGDVLYIPRGWWHVAFPKDSPSLHLTFGVSACTGLSFIDWLRNRLRQIEVFRRDIPLVAGDAAVAAHLDALKAALLERWSDGVEAEFLAARNATAQPSREAGFPGCAADRDLPESATLALSIARRLRIRDLPAAGAIEIVALGRPWRLPAGVRPAIEKLAAGDRAPVADLVVLCAGAVPPAETRRVLRQLVSDGVLAVVSSSWPDAAMERAS